MKEIEKYVKFAIDNGYKEEPFEGECTFMESIEEGYYDDIIKYKYYLYLITSRDFIEAIARGLIKEGLWINLMGDFFSKDEYKKQMEEENKKNKDITKTMYYITIVNIITTEQAVSIREEKLDEFINNILPNEILK